MKQIKPKTNNTTLDTLILGDKNLITYIQENPDTLPSTINYLDDDQKNELLKHFCNVGDLKYVKYLVSKDANIHIDYEYPLCGAVINNHLDIVKYLVSKGANVNISNEYPLCLAVINGYLEIVKYLVSKGANIHMGNEFSLRQAIENEHLEIVKYLVSQGADIHMDNGAPLRLAIDRGNVDAARYLVSQGVNINCLHPDYQYLLEKLLNKK